MKRMQHFTAALGCTAAALAILGGRGTAMRPIVFVTGVFAVLCMIVVGCQTTGPSSEVSTTLVRLRPGLESAPTFSADLSFHNKSAVDCLCRRYTLHWQGGRKDIYPDKAFLIPADGAIERSCALGYLVDPQTFKQTASVAVFCEQP